MGRQSSRLYYNGKDHKDIYYNGKYHNAMFFKDQGGLIWQKLADSAEFSGCVINTKQGDNDYDTDWSINTLFADARKIESSGVYTYNASTGSGNPTMNQIVSGKNRAFGLRKFGVNSGLLSAFWVSNDGRYWKKHITKNQVYNIYPCYDGLLYTTPYSQVVKVTLDDYNNVTEEKIIFYGFNTAGYSENGVWEVNGKQLRFLTHTGLVLSENIEFIDPDGGSSGYSYANSFVMNNKNYIVLKNNTWEHTKVMSCNEASIVEEYSDWGSILTQENVQFYPYNSTIYLYRNSYDSDVDKSFYGLYSTSDFANLNLVKAWYEDEYIELNLIGGEYSGIDTVRLFPYRPSSQSFDTEIVENVLNVYKFDLNYGMKADFIGSTLADTKSVMYQAQGTLYKTLISIYLDSVIDVNISGFAYFTANIGVGVSYPESEE
jgi:hypothetical protein